MRPLTSLAFLVLLLSCAAPTVPAARHGVCLDSGLITSVPECYGAFDDCHSDGTVEAGVGHWVGYTASEWCYLWVTVNLDTYTGVCTYPLREAPVPAADYEKITCAGIARHSEGRCVATWHYGFSNQTAYGRQCVDDL